MSERDDLQHAAELLGRLIPQTTPGPWRDSTVDSNRYGALIADTCTRDCDEWLRRYAERGGEVLGHPHDGYGGCLVGESHRPEDRRLIAVLRNAAEALPELLRAIAEEDPLEASKQAVAVARAVVATHRARTEQS